MKATLDSSITSVVGVAFKVVQPKWSDDKPTRGSTARLSVVTSQSMPAVNIALDDKLVMSLNADDADRLAKALIIAADRVRWAAR